MVNFERLTDEELAMLYIGGNDSAFDELLSRTQEKVFSYIMFVVKDVEIANDLFQDTFVKIIVRLQQGRYVSSGTAFLDDTHCPQQYHGLVSQAEERSHH